MPPRPRAKKTPDHAHASTTCGPACLVRINRLHTLLSTNSPVNAEALAREWEISSRTIKRDIDLMRDQFAAPIEWDASAKTHRYTRPYELALAAAAPRITADEALALILASRAFAAWRGSPLGRALASALEKMSPVLGGSISLAPGEISRIIYEPLVPGDCETDAERKYLPALLDAIRMRLALRITYKKPRARDVTQRIIHPLHLAIFDQRWLLVAHDTKHRALRNFLLSRITSIQKTDTRFKPPAGFDAEAYFAGSFGLFTGERHFIVRIRFDVFAAPYIRERRWHPSQTLRELPDGGVEARMRLNNLIDVRRWILGWGRHAVALAPTTLVTAVKNETSDTLMHYGGRASASVKKTKK